MSSATAPFVTLLSAAPAPAAPAAGMSPILSGLLNVLLVAVIVGVLFVAFMALVGFLLDRTVGRFGVSTAPQGLVPQGRDTP